MDERVLRTRTAVLRAALELLVESGPSGVTVDAVVARSGVAKSTIYRHWDTRDAMLVDVLEHAAPALDAPDPDLPFAEALRALVQAMVDVMNDPERARVIPALLLLKRDGGDIADIEDRLERRQVDVVAGVLDRGVAEGVLREGVDPQVACALLAGPVLFSHLTGALPTDHVLVDHVVACFLVAHRA